MSEEAFYRQRRSLNIISIAIIVYFITGIEFEPGGMPFRVTHEVVAYLLVWVAFFYFWWRFYLFGEDERCRWRMDFLYALSRNNKYRSLYSQPAGANQNEPTVWAPALHAEGFRRYVSWEEAYLVGIRSDDGEIQYATPATFSDSINPVMQKWSVGPETTIPLKWRKYALPAFKAIVSAMTNRSGTQWALPNFLAYFALICGVSSLMLNII